MKLGSGGMSSTMSGLLLSVRALDTLHTSRLCGCVVVSELEVRTLAYGLLNADGYIKMLATHNFEIYYYMSSRSLSNPFFILKWKRGGYRHDMFQTFFLRQVCPL